MAHIYFMLFLCDSYGPGGKVFFKSINRFVKKQDGSNLNSSPSFMQLFKGKCI